MQAQAEGRSKSRDLQRGEKHNQSLFISILFRLISGDKTVHLFIYEAKNKNLESLCLALSEVDKRNICSLSPMGWRGGRVLALRLFLNTKGWEDFLTIAVFQNHRAQVNSALPITIVNNSKVQKKAEENPSSRN